MTGLMTGPTMSWARAMKTLAFMLITAAAVAAQAAQPPGLARRALDVDRTIDLLLDEGNTITVTHGLRHLAPFIGTHAYSGLQSAWSRPSN